MKNNSDANRKMAGEMAVEIAVEDGLLGMIARDSTEREGVTLR
jgi:hypothetical protein